MMGATSTLGALPPAKPPGDVIQRLHIIVIISSQKAEEEGGRDERQGHRKQGETSAGVQKSVGGIIVNCKDHTRHR